MKQKIRMWAFKDGCLEGVVPNWLLCDETKQVRYGEKTIRTSKVIFCSDEAPHLVLTQSGELYELEGLSRAELIRATKENNRRLDRTMSKELDEIMGEPVKPSGYSDARQCAYRAEWIVEDLTESLMANSNGYEKQHFLEGAAFEARRAIRELQAFVLYCDERADKLAPPRDPNAIKLT